MIERNLTGVNWYQVTSTRILLVDDNDAWLGVISGILKESPRWRVVGEARDGFEAIQKAKLLRPDVILLDVGLPQLDGFQAARQIRTACPTSRILFLTQFSAPEAAELAVMLGATGYVLKSEAAVDLLPALEAVAEGRTFVSRALGPGPHNRSRLN